MNSKVIFLFILLPYDDAGHGSHCAAIVSGEGVPVLDVNERTVSTYSLGLPGVMGFEGIYNITAAHFNVTDPGLLELFTEFTDLALQGCHARHRRNSALAAWIRPGH